MIAVSTRHRRILEEMAAHPRNPTEWQQRKERFRAYMKAFNPTAPAQQSVDAGLVIPDLHDGLYKKIAARVEIEPGSHQLVLGGIGSGKTTELVLATRHLREKTIDAAYCEIASFVDPTFAGSGVLLTLAAFTLMTRVRDTKDPRVLEVGKFIHRISEQEVDIRAPRKTRFRFFNAEVAAFRSPLSALLEMTRDQAQPVILFDGLDRLPTSERFSTMVDDDLELMKQLGITVVLVGPPTLLYANRDGVLGQFDRVHEIPTLSTGDLKLETILVQRDPPGLLDRYCRNNVCRYSGGVIRDLITLARDAAEEAYSADAERVEVTHVEKVARRLGLSYLRGLSPTQTAVLRSVVQTGGFDHTDPDTLYLLLTRRIIEHSPTEFEVHPALQLVLDQPLT